MPYWRERSRASSALAVCVPVIMVCLVVAGCAAPPSAPVDWRTAMLQQVNSNRVRSGARALTMCAPLTETSQRQSVDMSATRSLSHVGADGSSISQRVADAGLGEWTALGENVASGFATVDAVVRGLLKSPVHRANLLNRSYTSVGFGAASDDSGVLYWTQDFSRGGTC